MKTILFFGTYDRKYARTLVLRNGFERNGWKVEECHIDPRTNRGVSKYFKLAALGMSARKQKYDLVLVGFPGHTVVWLARLLFGKEILFDAFLSLFDTNVSDRKLYSGSSWRGRYDRILDTWSCRLAGRVLLDTEGNIEYFVNSFNLPREKFIRVFIGADDEVFSPRDVPEEEIFTVHFHGTFIPLQGIRYIVKAADILRDKNIHFRLIGHGQESAEIDASITSSNLGQIIERIPKIPSLQVAEYMAKAHLVLGIFGESDKSKRAIPNKVYEAMAMGKAIITSDARGIQELPNYQNSFSLVPPGDSSALADAILELKENPEKRKILGVKAREIFTSQLSPEFLVERLLAALK
jgi:glycosyltransferase involved in cell wall biosynthesis